MLNMRSRGNFNLGKRNLSNRHHTRAKHLTTSEKHILYGDEASPPVRFVTMTAFVLGVKLEHRKVDLFASENRSESYKRINPLQKVPALVTPTSNICDSHAISLYLCRKWDKSCVLYPKDDTKRAKVDEILFYNSSTLFPIDSEIFTTFFAGLNVDDSKTREWTESLDFLEDRLNTHPWLAGDKMQLCDLCAASTITSMMCLVPLSDHHVRLKRWLDEIMKLPCYDINERGLARLKNFVDLVKSQIH